jgi:hypothetical protein
MNKVLPGISREAWGFLTGNFSSLVKLSVVPALAYVTLSIFQIKSMANLYRSLGTMTVDGNIDPHFMGNYFRGMGLMSLSSLLGMIVLCNLFVSIIRFQKTGEVSWLITDRAGIIASLMTFLYGLGIMMLTMLVYIGAILGGAILAAIIGAIGAMLFGGSTMAAVLLVVLLIASIFALFAGLYWFMFRFLVALPGVALGSSPDFFKDMWPLAKGEGWGLPWRALLATIVAYIPIGIVTMLLMGSALGPLFSNPAFTDGKQNPADVFPLMADVLDSMAPLSAVSVVLFMPFIWFMSLMLGAAFQRFRNKQIQAVAK